MALGESRRASAGAAALLGACLLAAGPAPAVPSRDARGEAVALRHRIELPEGSQLLLRREYRAIFRRPMRWGEGLLLEPVQFAALSAAARAAAGGA